MSVNLSEPLGVSHHGLQRIQNGRSPSAMLYIHPKQSVEQYTQLFYKMEFLYSIFTFFFISNLYSVLARSLSSHLSLPHQSLPNSFLTLDDSSRLITDQSPTKKRAVLKRNLRHYHNLFSAVQHVGNGWSLYWNQLDISRTNVNLVAAQLLDFYTQVLAAAEPTWSSQPPATAHGAFVGDVSIHFHSDAPISWEWIQSFLIAAVRYKSTL